jgi:hypothetical protein
VIASRQADTRVEALEANTIAPIIALKGHRQELQDGRRGSSRDARYLADRAEGRVRRDHGHVGIGQVDTDEHHWMFGRADERSLSPRWREHPSPRRPGPLSN